MLQPLGRVPSDRTLGTQAMKGGKSSGFIHATVRREYRGGRKEILGRSSLGRQAPGRRKGFGKGRKGSGGSRRRRGFQGIQPDKVFRQGTQGNAAAYGCQQPEAFTIVAVEHRTTGKGKGRQAKTRCKSGSQYGTTSAAKGNKGAGPETSSTSLVAITCFFSHGHGTVRQRGDQSLQHGRIVTGQGQPLPPVLGQICYRVVGAQTTARQATAGTAIGVAQYAAQDEAQPRKTAPVQAPEPAQAAATVLYRSPSNGFDAGYRCGIHEFRQGMEIVGIIEGNGSVARG